MPDLIKAALALQKERAAGGKGAPAKKNTTTQKKETVHPDSFILGLTGQDGDAPRVPKTKKAAEVDKRLRLEAEAEKTQQAKNVQEEDLFSSFGRGLASYMGDSPPPREKEEPRYRYIPEIDEPEGKVYHERDLDAYAPLGGTEKKLNPLGQYVHRQMTFAEEKEYREQEEIRRRKEAQERQQDWTGLKNLTAVTDWIMGASPLTRDQRERMVAEAMLHPDEPPTTGVDPKWRINLWNGMEQAGANDMMRRYIRSKEQNEWAERQREAGMTEDKIIAAMIQEYEKNGIAYNEHMARDELALSALNSGRADPDFFARITPETMSTVMNMVKTDPLPTNAMWTPYEKALYAYLYDTDGAMAQLEYLKLMDETWKLRLAAERAAKIEGKGYEVFLPAIASAVIKAGRNLGMGVKSLWGDTEPLRLTQVEADAKAYLRAVENEDTRSIANALSYVARASPELAATLSGHGLVGLGIGLLSGRGATIDEAIRSGKSVQEALASANLDTMVSLMLSKPVDTIIDGALPAKNKFQEGVQELLKQALSEYLLTTADEAVQRAQNWPGNDMDPNQNEDPYPIFKYADRSVKHK